MVEIKKLKWILRVVVVAMPFAGIRVGYNIIVWSVASNCNEVLGILSLMLGGTICMLCGVGVGYATKYVIDNFPRFLDWLFND